jgi:hypothetical protein
MSNSAGMGGVGWPRRTDRKLNMGKSWVRFKNLEDLPLDVIGETIARAELDRFLDHYRAARGSSRATRSAEAL